MKQDIQTDKLALAFELADDKQIAAFAKEYAQADDSFAEYIVEKILPASPNDEDCTKKSTLFSMLIMALMGNATSPISIGTKLVWRHGDS